MKISRLALLPIIICVALQACCTNPLSEDDRRKLSSMVTDLERLRSSAESGVREAKDVYEPESVKLTASRRAYAKAKSESDALIASLDSSIRFGVENEELTARQLDRLAGSAEMFEATLPPIEPGPDGVQNLSGVLEIAAIVRVFAGLLFEVIGWHEKKREAAIDKYSKQLQEYRWRDWSEIDQ